MSKQHINLMLCAMLFVLSFASCQETVPEGVDLATRQDEIIQGFLTENGRIAERQASGLYVEWLERRPETASPNEGDSCVVHYTGSVMYGQRFDSSVLRDEPFGFILGAGQVIAGWEEGVDLINRYERARFYIPSYLGYGSRPPSAAIPANSILIFEVELLEFTRD